MIKRKETNLRIKLDDFIGQKIEDDVIKRIELIYEKTRYPFQTLFWFVPIYIYYIVADEFVRQSLLNLTKGRIQGLDLPFVLLDESVDPYTTYVTAFLSFAVFFGVYSLGAGNLTPRQYDIRAQLLA